MSTLKGIFPDPKPVGRKNFLHENVKNLRKMEQYFHKKEQEQHSQSNKQLRDKYQNIPAKVNSHLRKEEIELNKRVEDIVLDDKPEPEPEPPLRKDCSKVKKKGHKSQGIQTLDAKSIEDLYKEGNVRYPTVKLKVQTKPLDQGDIVDCFKKEPQKLDGNIPRNYRKGVVPKYIRDRKEAQEREKALRAVESCLDCPKGHISLPDCERKETLKILKTNYQGYLKELNALPIRSDTLRVQKRKMEIEKQLSKLEEGIKVFSRPRVYVKVNA